MISLFHCCYEESDDNFYDSLFKYFIVAICCNNFKSLITPFRFYKEKQSEILRRGFLSLLMGATLLNVRLWHRYFCVKFTKFVKTYFLQSTSPLLPLFVYWLS